MDECCAPPPLNLGGSKKQDDAYRRVLWAVLAINAAMFAVEVIAGLAAGSAALQADALDFLGDAANYAISLFVVGMALAIGPRPLWLRARLWLPSAYGLSGQWSGTLGMERCRALSQWAPSASRRC